MQGIKTAKTLVNSVLEPNVGVKSMKNVTKLYKQPYEWASFNSAKQGLEEVMKLCHDKGIECNVVKSCLQIGIPKSYMNGYEQVKQWNDQHGMLRISLAGGQMSSEEFEALYDLIIDHEWFDVLTFNMSMCEAQGEYVKESYNYSKFAIEDLIITLLKNINQSYHYFENNDYDFDFKIYDFETINGRDKIVYSDKLIELGLRHFISDYGRKDLVPLLENSEELKLVIEKAFQKLDRKQLGV